VTWTEIRTPSVLTTWIRVECPKQKILIRPNPSIFEPPVGHIDSGEEIEVFIRTVSGFYNLADGRVIAYI
jgi:hypothetical protein